MKNQINNPFFNIELAYKFGIMKFLILSTDGINTFEKDMRHEVTDFKTTTGKFLQRRINKIKKDFEHSDDLGLAGWYDESNNRQSIQDSNQFSE
jgi:hypothetical protein